MDECIDVLPAQQRTTERWHQGTADALYQNICTLQQERPQVVLVLGGDHIYKMDYGEMIAAHLERRTDLAMACTEVPRAEATRFGVIGVDESWRIQRFQEKPSEPDYDQDWPIRTYQPQAPPAKTVFRGPERQGTENGVVVIPQGTVIEG